MEKGFKAVEHIGIYSPNTKKLAEWYIDIFGLDVVLKIEKDPDSKSVYFLKSNSTVIEILPSNENRKEDSNIDNPGIRHIGITVNDFNQTEEYLEGKGVTLNNVRETSVGWKIGYLKDLDGNTIEIIYRPNQPF